MHRAGRTLLIFLLAGSLCCVGFNQGGMTEKNSSFEARKNDLVVLSGSTNPDLTQKICENLGIQMNQIEKSQFTNGETFVNLGVDVGGKHVFIVQTSIQGTVNDNLMELLLTVDACKQDKAKRVTAVIPLFPYSRQDKRLTTGTPMSAELMSKLMAAAGIDQVITIDLHSKIVENYFSDIVNLKAEPVFIDWIRTNICGLQNCVIVSPDGGGASRVRDLAVKMNLDFCVFQKKRIIANEVETMTLSDPDKVRGRVAVLIDDMIDTCGTLVLAVRKLKEAGATKVYAIATHGIFSGQAIERIENSEDLDLVVVTNTIPKLESCEKIRWIDVSPLFAQAIIEASA